LVTADEGSGIVHLSPGSGPEDYQVAKREGLPMAPVIDEAGNYLAGYGFLAGQNAKDNPDLIFDYLKVLEQGRYFYKLEPYAHRYPVCWRCKTELVWRLVKEWYIKMDFLRRPMRQVTEKINWLPTWGKNQELDWLRNMHDWLISKKRYWGLALPIWECSCGFFEVIGSCEELKKKAVSGWTKFVGHSPHRPWLDEVKIRCPKCGQEISRIKDVGNPWLDAGIVAYSTLTEPKTGKVSYLTDKKYWREWFPADFITECFPGQFKNWFYSLLAMSTVLEKTLPCKTILGHALVRDEKGEEMHKSKGNAIWFDEAAEKMGVDVMRWLYVTQNPELNLNFGYRIADETRRRFHLILWNIYNFFISRANADGWQKVGEPVRSNHVFDQWVMSLLNKLVKQGTVALDRYDAFTASHALENFVIDLSTWYVRRSRERGDKNNFYWTLWEVLATLAQLLAPFIPFLAEEIYYNLTDGESVHLASWPKVSKIDEKLLSEMAMVRKICELGNAERKQAGIRVRQPLNQLRIANCELRINSGLIDLIKEELNVKKVVFIKKEGGLAVELDTEITRQLREEGKTRDLIRKIQELRKKAKLDLTRQIVVKGPWFPTRPELVNYLKRKVLAKELVKADELCLV
jgi:isoleucyl-tRNA synthetase